MLFRADVAFVSGINLEPLHFTSLQSPELRTSVFQLQRLDVVAFRCEAKPESSFPYSSARNLHRISRCSSPMSGASGRLNRAVKRRRKKKTFQSECLSLCYICEFNTVLRAIIMIQQNLAISRDSRRLGSFRQDVRMFY